jgi:MscS family membrane protein
MNELLNHVFLSNPVRDYLIVAAVILLAYLLKRFTGAFSSRLLFYVMRQFGREVDREAFSRLVLGPIETFLFLFISYLALVNLKFPELLFVKFGKTDTSKAVEAAGTTIIILAFFRMLLRSIDYFALVMERKANLTPDYSDNQLILFFKDFFKVLLVIVCLLAILNLAFGRDITKILAGLSIVGAAIALAARESLENLIASFIIFFDKPFTAGDLVKVNTITGVVERIGLRSTRIRTTDKTYVTVPNKQMVDSIVDNLTLRTQRRAELKLELDLKTSRDQIQELKEAIQSLLRHPLIVTGTAMLNDIQPEAFLLHVEYFTDAIPIDQFNQLKQELNFNVIGLLEQHGIEIAGAERERKAREPM